MRFSVQWQRCSSPAPSSACITIPGATARSYRLTRADLGKSIHFRVIARNRGGSTKAWARRTALVKRGPGGTAPTTSTATTTTTTPTTSTTTTTTTTATTTTTTPQSGKSVVLVDQPWFCDGAVDLDLVKVTIRDVGKHAVYLQRGCTGTIRRIEIETWRQDGLKVGGAHDLVIESGIITCHDREADTHQDGVQAQSGERVTFRNLRVDCRTANNAAFFVSAVGAVPTDLVCEHCMFLPANSTVNIKKSIRSGVRDSTVCRGNAYDIRIQSGAVDPVNTGNVVLSRSDPRCTGP